MKYFLPVSLLFILASCTDEQVDAETVETTLDTIDSLIADSTRVEPEILEIHHQTKHDYIAFGYANQEGSSVLALTELKESNVEEFTKGIGDNGKWLDLAYEGVQESTDMDNNRDTPYNFDDAGGFKFEAKNGHLDEWNTVLMVSDAFFVEHELLLPKAKKSGKLTREQQDLIEAQKSRKVVKSELCNSYELGDLFFVEFAKEGDSLLVSLLWIGKDKHIVCLDFPAVADEISSWRVDDGGIFDFESYQTLAVIKGPQGIELFTDWMGAEGSSIEYLIESEGVFRPIKNAYRYMAPL